MVHGSWLKTHGSCLKARGSRLMAHAQEEIGDGSPRLGRQIFLAMRHEPLAISNRLIVSASRSPPGQVPKKLEFGSFFSQSGGSLASFLVDFSIIGGTLGALGANFWCPKAVRATTGAPRGATPEIPSSFGTDLGTFFEYFLICWHLFLSIVFCWVPQSICYTFLLHFDIILYMFAYLSTSLILVIFCNPSVRKHVFGKSDFIKFNTFSTCFFDLVPKWCFY